MIMGREFHFYKLNLYKADAYPRICSLKELKVCSYPPPPGQDACPSSDYPMNMTLATVYTLGWRGTEISYQVISVKSRRDDVRTTHLPSAAVWYHFCLPPFTIF